MQMNCQDHLKMPQVWQFVARQNSIFQSFNDWWLLMLCNYVLRLTCTTTIFSIRRTAKLTASFWSSYIHRSVAPATCSVIRWNFFLFRQPWCENFLLYCARNGFIRLTLNQFAKRFNYFMNVRLTISFLPMILAKITSIWWLGLSFPSHHPKTTIVP